MIQRIQTVYLALAALCLILTVAFDFALYELAEGSVTFNLYGVSANAANANTWFPYFIVIPIVAALCIFSMLQYKNRKLQLNIGKVLYLLILVVIALLFIDVTGLVEKLGQTDEFQPTYAVGMFLPVAALPFVFLANRSIKKDEALVRSVDRLR